MPYWFHTIDFFNIFAWSIFVLAAIPAVLTIWNHIVFRKPPQRGKSQPEPEISILIPARNEASNIENAVLAALDSANATIEVIVLNDHSTDRTAAIVEAIGINDSRVKLIDAPELPAGWCGKMHACARLAEHARYDLLLFVDADVTMSTEAPARLAAYLKQREVQLVSTFPYQITGTFLEKLLIPLIEYILLAYLPLQVGRWSKMAGFGVGCGQVFLADRLAYETANGHSAIKSSMHDGVKLPRSFRRSGFKTDICNGNELVSCRMYHNAKETWSGLLKNAHEGIANKGAIIPFTVLLIGGSILPGVLLVEHIGYEFAMGPRGNRGFPNILIFLALLLAIVPRTINTIRFRQSWLGWLFHPLAIILFLMIQWQAFFRHLRGKKPAWKGRSVG